MGAKLTWHGLAEGCQWLVQGKPRSFAPVISRLARPPMMPTNDRGSGPWISD